MPRNHERPDGYIDDPIKLADDLSPKIHGNDFEEFPAAMTPYNGEMRLIVTALRFYGQAKLAIAADAPKPPPSQPTAEVAQEPAE